MIPPKKKAFIFVGWGWLVGPMCPLDFHHVWPLGRFSGDVLHAGASGATSGATSGRPSTSTGCRGRGVSAGVQSASGTRLECLNVENEKNKRKHSWTFHFRCIGAGWVYLVEILEMTSFYWLKKLCSSINISLDYHAAREVALHGEFFCNTPS